MQSLDFHASGRHFLQIPGPSPVPDRILRAMNPADSECFEPAEDVRGVFRSSARHVRIVDPQGQCHATGFGQICCEPEVQQVTQVQVPAGCGCDPGLHGCADSVGKANGPWITTGRVSEGGLEPPSPFED